MMNLPRLAAKKKSALLRLKVILRWHWGEKWTVMWRTVVKVEFWRDRDTEIKAVLSRDNKSKTGWRDGEEDDVWTDKSWEYECWVPGCGLKRCRASPLHPWQWLTAWSTGWFTFMPPCASWRRALCHLVKCRSLFYLSIYLSLSPSSSHGWKSLWCFV